MRTIKFRAKDEKGEWHYGDLEHSPIGKFCRIHEYRNNGFYKWHADVDPDTVGQFTGLHDVDDTEIYEGDRVFFNDPLNDERSEATVYWNETFLRFMLCTGVGDYDLTDNEELQLKVIRAPRIMVNANKKPL